MRRTSRSRPIAALAGAALLLTAPTLWALLVPADLADVAPDDAPDGTVDAADVEQLLRWIADETDLDEDRLDRADLAPVTPISTGATVPQLVRPNPNPAGPLDIGDAVIVARRAAGLIAFDQLNQAPVVSFVVAAAVVSLPSYVVRGRVTDDAPIADGSVELQAGGVTTSGLGVTAGPLAREGTFEHAVQLVEGANALGARAFDREGRRGRLVSAVVTLDQVPPTLTVAAPVDGFVTGQATVEVSGSASDEHGVTVTVRGVPATQLPPDLWGSTVNMFREGESTLVVVARDGAVPPNETTRTVTVVRDTTPPVVEPDVPPDAVHTDTVVLEGLVRDAWGIASVTVGGRDATVVWDAAARSGRWSAEVPVFEGENHYEVVAVDKGGNRATAGPVSLRGDFVPPVVTLESPEYVDDAPTTVALGFSEPVLVDGFGTRVFAPPRRVDDGHTTIDGVALEEGPNELVVRVRDLAGNVVAEALTITLDTHAPTVVITKVSNPAFTFVPPGGLDDVLTNAPTVTVEGTVTDSIGVAGVTVNGFEATVNEAAGTFVIAGVPLVPRANTLTATAKDHAGNPAEDAVVVRRDAEGPVLDLDFARAAYVSTRSPAPPPFDAALLPARLYRGTSDIPVDGTASDPTYTNRVEALVVRLDGAALPVAGAAPFARYSFTLPASVLTARGLHLLEVEATDSLGNRTLDVQAMLNGQWVVPGDTFANAIGLAVGPAALDAIGPIIEAQVAGMNGDLPDQTQSLGGGISMTIYGLAFCRPPGNPARPPYACTPVVDVDLSLTAAGHVAIRITMPTLYVGIRSSVSWWPCNYARDGYMVASPVTITTEADFVNTASGVQLQARAGTTNVDIGDLDITSNHDCVDLGVSIAGALLGGLENTVASMFEGQVDSLLSSVNGVLGKPLMETDETDMALWIARASNDASAIRFWLDGHGDPCPSPAAYTTLADTATSDPNDKKRCPADSPRLAPGSYATPNTTAASLPTLDMIAPDGTGVSAEVGANDDFVNYMVHEQWAMGAFDMAIDQSFLGEDSAISLDTDAISLFVPDLKRADVVKQVPLGSGLKIQMKMPMAPVVSGKQTTGPFYELSVGDMEWRFLADADGNAANGHEKLVFVASVSLSAQAGLAVRPAATDNEDDVLVVDLASPVVHADITENPLILNEASVRSAITSIINLVLPQLTSSLASVALPANTARFSAVKVEAPSQDFLVLSGALIQTITLSTPVADTLVTADPVVLTGTVDGLVNSGGATVALWLPGDTAGRVATITARPDVNSLAYSVSLARAAIPTGANTARIVATDGNGKKASLPFDLNRGATGVTRSGGSGCGGCSSSDGGAGPLGVLLLLLAVFLARGRRAVPAAPVRALLTVVLSAGLAGCPESPLFNGPKVVRSPVFLVSELQIGDETQGFNVDEASPNGDPDPDNALQVLGSLANEALGDAVKEGSVLLLVEFPGLTNLPAPGETGVVEAVIWLGVDTDGDASDNFSGSEVFAKDPASFDESGKPLIVFRETRLTAAADGTVTMKGGPSTFTLKLPLQGSVLELQIAPTYIEATLAGSSLRKDGVEARAGLLGGVLPAAPLARDIEGLPFAPLSLLASEIDVDLNGDGNLDTSATAENEDGLSAGIVFAAVPAFLSDVPVNVPPVISLEALPDPVTVPEVIVSGTVKDRDHDCALVNVTLTVNGLMPSTTTVTKTASGCVFDGAVRLAVGRNAILATATDPAGGTRSAEVVTHLEDHAPPTVVLTGPTGTVHSPAVTLTGRATDDIGILAVQLDVAGTLVVVPGEQLASDGSFSVPATLPGIGPSVITAVAKDVGDNVSAPVSLEVTFEDIDAPEVVFTAASTANERVESGSPWTLSAADVVVEGRVEDNAGPVGVVAAWNVSGAESAPLDLDPDTGAFETALSSLARGTHVLQIATADVSGNRRIVEGRVIITDLRGPAVTVESPATLVHEAAQELVLRLSDDWEPASSLTVEAALGDDALTPVPFDEASGAFRRPILLTLGANALVLEARDPSGNVTVVEGVIELVDETPPLLEVTAPDDDGWTIAPTIAVTGRASDNIGPTRVAVDVAGALHETTPSAVGTFSVEVPLENGPNTLAISAIDAAGLSTLVVRRIERRDPNAVATVALDVNPGAVPLGNADTSVTLTAVVTRLAGGPVPDGTAVHVRAVPETLGVLDGDTVVTTGGVAQVRFRPGSTPGLVTFTAEAERVTDTSTLTIAPPSAVAVDVCLAPGARLAGASFELGIADGAAFVARAPASDAFTGVGPAETFHAHNRAALPTTVLLAGTRSIAGSPGGTPFARLTWPLQSGLVSTADVELTHGRLADDLGATTDAGAALSVCSVEHLLSDLPPRVALDTLASPTVTAGLVVTGTVDDADLAGCAAVLVLNGRSVPLDVSSGRIAQAVTLLPGVNTIAVVVTDAGGGQGSDELQVRFDAPNVPPQVSVASPGGAVTTASVVVEGPVSDADDGLSGLTVTARVGSADPVPAAIDAAAGRYRATVTLQSGANTLRVTATDARGASTVVTHTTALVAAVPPPRITLTAPTEGQAVPVSTVALRGRVDDGGNPATITVTLSVNGVSQPITFSPFTRELSATVTLATGANTLEVTATDLTSQSDVETRHVEFAVADAPPRLTITSPTAGARLATTTVAVRGTVRDDRPLSSLRSLKVNGVAASVDEAAGTWTADVPLATGAHTLTAEVVDERGQSATAAVAIQIFAPVVVINYLQIGGPTDGFNVDSTPPHALSDAAPDNALSGLSSIANGPLRDAVAGTGGDQLLLLFEFVGLTQLPATGQRVTVDLVGYLGTDRDGDPSDNFSGREAFDIDPASYDVETGLPLIRFPNVVLVNDFGVLRVDTFPSNPARFQLDLGSTSPPLQLVTNPAFLRTTVALDADGLRFNPGLLGGVVPASTLTVPVSAGDVTLVPLELILSSDPTNPVPDCDLNGDGRVDTTNATSTNPDGVSVGIVFTAVPASIVR